MKREKFAKQGDIVIGFSPSGVALDSPKLIDDNKMS